jgi:hypothetical protein
MRPSFDKTKEQLKEHDSNILKEAEEQKKKDKRIGRVHYNRRDRRER